MAKKHQKKTFFVQSRIILDTNAEVYASTIEEAIEVAKSLKMDDFVQIYGSHDDSKLTITGVFESNGGIE